MNDSYGVDPNAAASVDDFAKLLRQFGPRSVSMTLLHVAELI